MRFTYGNEGRTSGYLLKRTDTGVVETILEGPDTKDREEEHSGIYCRFCGHGITGIEQKTSRQGSHRHVFTNPSGITFEIGIFSDVPGCVNVTEPTFEFTWFKGYAWQVSICAHCGNHLGWFWQSTDDAFFGLILDRIVEGPTTH